MRPGSGRTVIEPMVRQRVRIRFSKSGILRYIGHQDLLVVLERLFRRAGVPLAMSQGFHPKPKISSPSALALGIAGEDEVLDLEMQEAVTVEPAALLESLNRHRVEGLAFLRADALGPESGKARLYSSLFVMTIPEEDRTGLAEKIEALLARQSFVVAKPNGKEVDVRPAVVALAFSETDHRLNVELLANKAAHNGPEVGIRELLHTLGLEDRLFRTIFPVRQTVRLTESS